MRLLAEDVRALSIQGSQVGRLAHPAITALLNSCDAHVGSEARTKNLIKVIAIVAPMVERFITTDRAFARVRKCKATS